MGPPVPGLRAKVANRGRYLKVRSTAKPACPAVDRRARAATIVPISAPSRRFDRAGRRVSIILAAGVIRADVFVVRRANEYCRTDLAV
jgi:hypothetical protein